jgi:kynureninase
MNSGAGSIGGCFVHSRHHSAIENENNQDCKPTHMNRLSGWWGHRSSDRFQMSPDFIPCEGAYGFRLSNPSVLLIACVRASLDIFDEVSLIYFLF